LEEFITGLLGYNLRNMSRVLKLLEFLPVDYNLIKRIITSFNNLHFDQETGIMHSLPSARVHELRGHRKLIALSNEESISLVTLAASISEENSLLDFLLLDFLNVKENRKKGQRTFKHLLHYISTVLHEDIQLLRIDQSVYTSLPRRQ
jgi:hypothetical protein